MRYCHFGVATLNFSDSDRGLEIELNTDMIVRLSLLRKTILIPEY